MRKKKSLALAILSGMVVVTMVPICLLGGFFISNEYQAYRNKIAQVSERLYSERRRMLRQEVEEAVNFIAFKKQQQVSDVRQRIRQRVYEASALAQHLYQTYNGKMSETKLKDLVRESLRPLRYNDGKGYFFATTLDGTEELFADRPTVEGKNILTLKDTRGKSVIKDMIALVKKQNEGFYSYHWSKPEQPGRDYPKVSFVKYFSPFNWFIGTGAYLDDLDDSIRKESLTMIESKKFGHGGYLFAGTYEGVSLTGPACGANLFDVVDKNGFFVVRELIAKARSGGGFVRCCQLPENGHSEREKLSYVVGLPDCQWYVGAGIYIDDLESEMARIKQEMAGKIRGHFLLVILAILFLLVLAFLVSWLLWYRVRNSFAVFKEFFQQATLQAGEIDAKKLTFQEFVELAEMANRMFADLRHSREEQATTEQELRLMALAVIHTTEMVLLYDAEARVEYVNPAFEKLSGFSLRELRGKDTIPLFTDRCSELTEARHRMVLGGQAWSGLLLGRRRDGSLYDCEGTVSPIFDEQGKLTGIVAVGRDVTRQLELEKRLRHTQKMEAIGTLAGGIAHDFNNILAAINGYSEISLLRLPADSEVREYLENILIAGERAADLVKQILIFSRRQEGERRPVQVSLIIKEALKLLRPTLPATIDIRAELNCDAKVLADPTQIHQLFVNLCTNAAQAMPEGGCLSIMLSCKELTPEDCRDGALESGDYIELKVADTGCGISEEIQERIFEPFFTTREEGQGTGLGLSLVHGIVEKISGEVAVTSRPGEGSMFVVLLPQATAGESAGRVTDSRIVGGRERILFVDDEELVVAVVREMLSSLGYRLTTCSSAAEALEKYLAVPEGFDLVITDLTMPGMSGLKLAEKLSSKFPELPIIICTGYCSEETEVRSRQLGIRELLMKPLVFEDLVRVVRRVLDGREK